MRKALAILIIIAVCNIYFITMKTKDFVQGKENTTTSVETEGEVDERIQAITESINTNYPEIPKTLIEVANEIMEIQYSEEWEPEAELESETILALRQLYSQKLLDLNPYEKQLESLRLELTNNHEKGIYLKKSEIYSIKFTSPDNALVEVFYNTTKGTQKREYTLVKEEGLWKIYSWKDLGQAGEDITLEE